MDKEKTREEYLEVLWYMKESDSSSLDTFKDELEGEFQSSLLDELVTEGLVGLNGLEVSLSDDGMTLARQLIRSHRLAERLIHDVLGLEYEKGACEFEHIINPNLVDSICTILGHPRVCPHGMPIPEGECCLEKAQTVESSVMPLDLIEVGVIARIAYVHAADDRQMHRLDNLCIRPGVAVRLHQRYPTFVIECENALVAIDDDVAASIHVWVQSEGVGKPATRERPRWKRRRPGEWPHESDPPPHRPRSGGFRHGVRHDERPD